MSQAPGFRNGSWTSKGDTGLAMILFDSADGARAASEQVPSTITDAVTLEGVEVREVVADA